ncbi:MAG TPA: hypothetical protein VF772_13360, partial [Terriglobales bacterium]
IRTALTTVGKGVGKVQHLHDALEPVKPEHEDLKVVEHAGERAYTLAAVPDSLASSFTGDDAAQKVYGNYYATLFTFRTAGEHPAALTLLWARDGGQWKIISYEVVAP